MGTDTTHERESGVVEEAREKGAELVSSAQQQVSEKADEVRGEAVFQLREQVARRSTETGQHIQAVGHVLRSGVDQLRTDGRGGSATAVDKIAEQAEHLGSYLQSADADRILRDVETFARRRPWLTAGAAAVAGFVASRLVKASSDRRYEGQARANSSAYPSQRTLATGVGE
jgi:ElaB/YqjD/DUF883 family membrane-anchored ribosome-binding protein